MNDAHQIEPELLQPPPRPVRARNARKQRQATVGFGLILMLGALLAVSAFLMRMAKYRGVTVPATIIGREQTRQRRRVRYYLYYRYSWRGRTYEESAAVDFNHYQTARIGAKARARLWPPRPQSGSYLVLTRGYVSEVIAQQALGAVLLIALGVAFFVRFYVKARNQIALLKNGVAVVARFVEGRQEEDLLQLDYEFPTMPGGVIQRVTFALPENERYKARQTLTVLYDPHEPRRSLLYAFSDYEIVPRA